MSEELFYIYDELRFAPLSKVSQADEYTEHVFLNCRETDGSEVNLFELNRLINV